MSQNTILELIGTTGTRPSITFFHVIVFFYPCAYVIAMKITSMKIYYILWKIDKILLSVLIKVKNKIVSTRKFVFHGIWLGTIFHVGLFQFVVRSLCRSCWFSLIFSSSKLFFFFTIFYQNYLQKHLILQVKVGKCIFSRFTGMFCFHLQCHHCVTCHSSDTWIGRFPIPASYRPTK